MKDKEKGIVLVEAIVALALIGLIAAGFLGAIGTSYKSTMLSVEMTTSESLARSQMEYIKQQQPYISAEEAGEYDMIEHPASYGISWIKEELAKRVCDGEYMEEKVRKRVYEIRVGKDRVLKIEIK